MVVFNFINFIKIDLYSFTNYNFKMIQTCYYHLIIYGQIVETDYFISDKCYLEEYEISKRILKIYIEQIRKNYIEDFKIEIFHFQIYDEKYTEVLEVLETEIKIIRDNLNKTKKIKKTVFDFSDFKDILDCL